MQLGMIGLGRMGANMVRRLVRHGPECVVYDANPANVRALVDEGAIGSASLDEFVGTLAAPPVLWIMVPAGAVDSLLADLGTRIQPGDIIIDGGSFREDGAQRHRVRADGGVCGGAQHSQARERGLAAAGD